MTEFTTTRPVDEDSEFAREARDDWFHGVLGGSGDVREAVIRHRARYGNAYELSAFRDSTRKRTRKAYELLGGASRRWNLDAAGPLGALIVRSDGLPLECSTIDFADLPSVAHLRDDPKAQFDGETVNAAKRDVVRLLDSPAIMFTERGKAHAHNHVHVISYRGACALGRKSKISSDELLKTARYFSKAPEATLENVVAYAEVKRACGRVTNRVRLIGLDDLKVTIAEVEEALGISLVKPRKATRKQTELDTWGDVGHCGLATASKDLAAQPAIEKPPKRIIFITAKMLREQMKQAALFKDGRPVTLDEIWPIQRAVVVADAAQDVPLLAPQIRFDYLPAQTAPSAPVEPLRAFYEVSEQYRGNDPSRPLFGAVHSYSYV